MHMDEIQLIVVTFHGHKNVAVDLIPQIFRAIAARKIDPRGDLVHGALRGGDAGIIAAKAALIHGKSHLIGPGNRGKAAKGKSGKN